MLALLAGVILAAQEPDLTQKVALDVRATRLKPLLEDLSKRTGVALYVSPNIAEEVGIVRTKDVPLATILKKISEVTGAEWIRERNDLVLRLTGETERRQRAEELRGRTALV